MSRTRWYEKLLIFAFVFGMEQCAQPVYAAGPIIWSGGTASKSLATGGTTLPGPVTLQNASGSQPQLQLSEDPDNGTNTVSIQSNASIADYTLTLPVDDGTTSQWLVTDGSGVLSWTNTTTTAKMIDGSADAVQLTVQGNATQTTLPFVVENSSGTDLFTVSNLGDVQNGNGTTSLPSYSFISDPDSGMYRRASNEIGFAVNTVDVMTVDQALVSVVGAISVASAVTNPSAFTESDATITGADVISKFVFSGNANATGGYFMKFMDASDTVTNEIGSVTAASATGVSFNTASDARLKREIVDFPKGLETVMAMQPRKYRWKEDNHEDRGLIAQELKKVYPWAVTGVDDGKPVPTDAPPMSIDYSKLTTPLIAAVQELARQNAALTERIKVLEAKSGNPSKDD